MLRINARSRRRVRRRRCGEARRASPALRLNGGNGGKRRLIHLHYVGTAQASQRGPHAELPERSFRHTDIVGAYLLADIASIDAIAHQRAKRTAAYLGRELSTMLNGKIRKAAARVETRGSTQSASGTGCHTTAAAVALPLHRLVGRDFQISKYFSQNT